MATVVVLCGGPGSVRVADLPAGATVIAADGGAELAWMVGLSVDLVVGDMDSISAETLAGIERVERHAAEKDATDLELALVAALRFEPERVLVLGGGGGRLDHLFGGLLLLAAEAYAGVRVDAQFGAAAVHVIRGERTLHGEPGELISLLAVHGRARGVVTDGLVYALRRETLEPGSSRGVSNVFAGPQARIALEGGVLLAVRPTGSVTAGS
ncbi:MAG TPA: thiamine diphosphokinase [Gaiellaceae bacterium]